MFTEGCVVLAEGTYDDGVFQIKNLGFPPPESASTTHAYIGNMNSFGGPGSESTKSDEILLNYEKQNENAMFVFLSDVWLDDSTVLDKLQTMLTGFESIAPIAFVIGGNFCSKPYGSDHFGIILKSFRAFVDIICEFSSIRSNSNFIFVPGPDDLTPSGRLLPKAGLFKSIRQYAEEKLEKVFFTTNPVRIRYCTQEIVFFREDLTFKLCRNCVKFPKDDDLTNHIARTIASQSHLAPLPLHVLPVFWSHDAALRLYPLPDLVVIADRYKAYNCTVVDCNIINPVLYHLKFGI